MDLDTWPEGTGTALALLAVVSLAATSLALTPLGPELPTGPDLGTGPARAGDGLAVQVASLDVRPLGLHGLEAHLALAAPGGDAVEGLDVRLEAVDAAGRPLASAHREPVTVPGDGRWTANLVLEAPGLVGDWEGTRVTGETGHRPPPLP